MAEDSMGRRGGARSRSGSRAPGRGVAHRSHHHGPTFDRLVRAIEGEIIPRLMMVHRVDHAAPCTAAVPWLRPGPDEVATLATLVLSPEAAPAIEYVEDLLDRGVPLEAAYLELLAPAARRLGALWEDDQLDFLQVTLGLGRLQQVVHGLGPAFPKDRQGHQLPHRVLLCPLPGEDHTFGLRIVSEFFRRAGWDVSDLPAVTSDELLATAQCEPFDIIGLSVSSDSRIEQAASIIAALRLVSLNPQVSVMVGGQAFVGQPGLLAKVGADATAPDGRQAAAQALQLIAARARASC